MYSMQLKNDERNFVVWFSNVVSSRVREKKEEENKQKKKNRKLFIFNYDDE